MNGTERAAWLASRRKGVGGSDVAGILGLSPWSTPYDVWHSKVADRTGDTPSEPMRWGTILEPVVLDEYDRVHGTTVERGLPIAVHPDHEWVIGSVDAIDRTNNRIVEAKTVGQFTAHQWDNDTIPPHYRLQAHWYMGVTGIGHTTIAALFSGSDYREFELSADPHLFAELVEHVGAWWEKHVVGGVAPEVSAKDLPLLAEFHAGMDDIAVLDPGVRDLVDGLVDAKARAKEAKAEADEYQARLVAALAGSDAGLIRGEQAPAFTYRASVRRGIDAKRFRAEHPDLAAEYATETTVRTLRVNKGVI